MKQKYILFCVNCKIEWGIPALLCNILVKEVEPLSACYCFKYEQKTEEYAEKFNKVIKINILII
jgi:hypothetical protein